jgi:hypothetical protein
VDPATIYVLKRDATYLMSGSIENRYPLTIVAEDGTGERPKLIPGVPTGGESSRPFRARDDITLKGLYITNEDELGKRLLRTIRVSADSVRVVIDDCHIDKSNQSAFRLDNEDNIIHLTNTIISDIGNYASPNNGRGVDDRGNDIDSLVVSNCTFYNLTSTVLRDGGGGKINYCDFNHNTIVNTGMQAIEVGEAIETHITNNVFVNGVFFGLGPQGGSEITEGYHILVYALNEDLKSAGVKQVVNIRNNNFYTDPALKAAWPEWVGTGRPLFNDVAQLGIATLSTDSTNIEEALTFTNGPVAPTALVTAWYAGQPGGIPVLTTVDTAVPFDLTGAPFNFAYPSTAQSYTASTGEQPLGDLTWHGLTIAASDRTTDFTPAVDAATADFNTDGKVDFSDFVLFAQAFGKAQDDTGYDAKFDLDGDNKIAFGDFVRFAQSFGKTLSKPAGLSKPVGDLPPGVNSNTGFSLVTRPTGKADEVEVAVRLSAAVRVEGYKLRVQYNDSAIELLKASAAEGASVLFDDLAERDVERAAGEPLPVVLQISTQPGKIILADMVRPEAAIQGEGVLIRLSFRLLDKTVAGQVVIDEVQVSDGLGRINDLTGARLEELRALPTEYALSRNYPNPFNPDTQIPYQLPEAGDVSLVVYNMLGQQVSALVSDEQQPGYYRVVWDGKDSRGRQVSSGVYLVRMAAGEFSDVKKVLLLK